MRSFTKVLRRVSVLTLTFLIIVSQIQLHTVKADETENTEHDIVLVIDCSASRLRCDPDNLTFQTVNQFIECLPYKIRVSIVVFGAEYGSQAYPVGSDNSIIRNRVKEAFPLQSISTAEVKYLAQKALYEELERKGQYSPLGYALEAATKILMAGGAADGNADILLFSDGELETLDEEESFNNEYKIMQTSTALCKKHGWPVSCISTNSFDVEKSLKGKKILEEIAETTEGKTYILHKASDIEPALQDALQTLFGNSYDVPQARVDLKARFLDDVKESLERKVCFLCEMDKLEEIVIHSASGKQYTIAPSDGNQETEEFSISLTGPYLVVDIPEPTVGTWTYEFIGVDEFQATTEVIQNNLSGSQSNENNEESRIIQSVSPEETINLDLNDLFGKNKEGFVEFAFDYAEQYPELDASNIAIVDNYLSMKAPLTKGRYPIVITGMDSQGNEQTVTVLVTVVNQPLQMIAEDKVKIRLKEKTEGGYEETVLKWSDYFEDPDGYAPVIYIEKEALSNDLKLTEVEGGLIFSWNDIGRNTTITVYGIDANDHSEIRSLNLEVAPQLPRILIIIVATSSFFLILVLLAVLMLSGRRIYGIWDISTSSGHEEDFRPGITRSGRHARCRVDDLLNELLMETGFGNAELIASNQFSKRVFLNNLQGLEVEFDGKPLVLVDQKSLIEIKRGQEVTLRSGGLYVSLARLR